MTVDKGLQGEFEDVSAGDDEIRQGDLLDLIPDGEGPDAEWTAHFGVIVTANCDLVYGKHAGILSYVPIVPIPVYLRLLLFPRILESQARSALTDLEEVLPSGSGWPTVERVFEMLQQARSDEIQTILSAKDESGSVRRQIRSLSACLSAQRTYDPALPFDVALESVEKFLRELREIAGHKELPPGHLVQKELTNRIAKQLPGDCLFLSSPVPSVSEGHIAYLRLIREISHDSIAKNAIEERRRRNRIRARRIARLSLVYLHRLTQQLTRVFSDIGLPETYERRRDDAVASRIASWVETLTLSQVGEPESS